jgi:hypothetical protein
MQTSYDLNMAAAFAGMKADARYDEVISFQAESAIAFGRGVVAGTNAATQVKQPTAGGTFKGIAVHTHKQPSSAGVARYEDTEMVNVMRKGRVWVEVSGVIALGNAVRMLNSGGQFTAATTGSTAISGCEFASAYATSSSPAIALLDINLPA